MNFKTNVEQSFRKVKADFLALKHNMGDWIRHLNNRQTEADVKIAELETRISQLEQKLIKLY